MTSYTQLIMGRVFAAILLLEASSAAPRRQRFVGMARDALAAVTENQQATRASRFTVAAPSNTSVVSVLEFGAVGDGELLRLFAPPAPTLPRPLAAVRRVGLAPSFAAAGAMQV